MKQKILFYLKMFIGIVVFVSIYHSLTNSEYRYQKKRINELTESTSATSLDTTVYSLLNFNTKLVCISNDNFKIIIDSIKNSSYKPLDKFLSSNKIKYKKKREIKDSIKLFIETKNEEIALLDEYILERKNLENRFPSKYVINK